MTRKRISTTIIFVVILGGLLAGLPRMSHAARILGFFPWPLKSHLLIHCSLADTLARAGHNVTVLGGLPDVYKNAKYRYIDLKAPPGYHHTMAKELINNSPSYYQRESSIISNVIDVHNRTFSGVVMQNFLQEHGEGSFDLVIVGYMYSSVVYGLGAHFKCPMIISFMIQPSFPLNKLIGNPNEYAYVPSPFFGLKQPMKFMQRVYNFLIGLSDQYIMEPLIWSRNKALYNYHFPASRYPSLDEASKNVSLIFVNHHQHSQGPIRPYVPALIEIGGIQIKEKPDPLPADIAQILDNSKEGVIYFSLGSNVQGNFLSENKLRAMFNVLSKLPHKVLWKWSDSVLPGSSSNIVFKSWLPQNDILAHPNIKLFITHAGQGSVVESQYHGVPMVAIPLFSEQPSNAANMAQSGFGVQIDYLTLTEESFHNAIMEVLNNTKYSKAVKNFMNIYRDRPMTARQLVVYWTEYVLRHNGAKHLRSPAADMNQFQLQSLDVLAFLSTIVFSTLFIIFKCYQFLFCRKSKSSKNIKVIAKKVN